MGEFSHSCGTVPDLEDPVRPVESKLWKEELFDPELSMEWKRIRLGCWPKKITWSEFCESTELCLLIKHIAGFCLVLLQPLLPKRNKKVLSKGYHSYWMACKTLTRILYKVEGNTTLIRHHVHGTHMFQSMGRCIHSIGFLISIGLHWETEALSVQNLTLSALLCSVKISSRQMMSQKGVKKAGVPTHRNYRSVISIRCFFFLFFFFSLLLF